MKKILLIISGMVGLIMLVRGGLFDSLFAFLVVGAIPGTQYTVPSTFMLLLTISILWLVIFRFTVFDMIQSASSKRLSKKRNILQKERLPKRRFERI